MSYNSPPLLHACPCLPFCLKLQMRMHHQVLRCSEQTTPANAPVNEAHMMLEIRHPNMRQQHSHCRKLWHNRSKSCPPFLFGASRRPRKRGIPAGTLLPSKHASEEAGFCGICERKKEAERSDWVLLTCAQTEKYVILHGLRQFLVAGHVDQSSTRAL